MSRTFAAVAVIFLWLAGMGWMLLRERSGTDEHRYAQAALRIQPATLYYSVHYGGREVGGASSAIDTTARVLLSEGYFSGLLPVGDSLLPASIRARAVMTRAFRLRDISVDGVTAGRRLQFTGTVQGDTTLLISSNPDSGAPALHVVPLKTQLMIAEIAGIALMLSGEPKEGREGEYLVFDPVSRSAVRANLQLGHDSLFIVADSAARRDGAWVVVHSDTVRAWQITGSTHGIDAWLDAEGRPVMARGGGYSIVRMPYEIAFRTGRVR